MKISHIFHDKLDMDSEGYCQAKGCDELVEELFAPLEKVPHLVLFQVYLLRARLQG